MLLVQFKRLLVVISFIFIIETHVVLSAARQWKFVIRLVDKSHRDKLQLSLSEQKPWLMKCARGAGVCVSSRACPWERLREDVNGDCVDNETGHVCCEVTTVRIPTDMFEMYDMK